MKFSDVVKVGTCLVEKKAEEGKSGVLHWLNKLGLGKKAEAVKEEAEVDRSGIFGEVVESLLARHFPLLSKLMDISSTLKITDRDSEVVPWQNEFETLTAFSMFVPDFLLKKITDPLVKSSAFMKAAENWPLVGEKWIKKLKQPKVNPDDVINVIRIMNQDVITGKVPVDKLIGALR